MNRRGMGQTKSLVVIHSPRPGEDAVLLEKILPLRRQQPQAPAKNVGSDPIILVWDEENFCLMILPSSQAVVSPWVVANKSILDRVWKAGLPYFSNRTQPFAGSPSGSGERSNLQRMVLPSGSSIVVITAESLATDAERNIVARCLINNDSLSSPPMADEAVKNLERATSASSSSLLFVNDTQVDPNASKYIDASLTKNNDPEKPKRQKRLDAPQLDTLSVKIMQQKGAWDTNFALNTREPYEFETDLFRGKILMIVRPPELDQDPYWSDRIFRQKKRRVVFNMQGKFKRKPQGPVYIGAEITSAMNLSLFTRGILGMLIKLLENSFPDLRYSFGDEKKMLAPRLAVPAQTAFQRLVVTPDGQEPPPMNGDPFEEPAQDGSNRKKCPNWEWNTSDTYSFSFFSMYVSLTSWKIVNLPVSPDINLRRLWNDGDCRIVMYENTGEGKDHSTPYLNYALNINVRYLGDQRLSVESDELAEDFEDIALDSDSKFEPSVDETESGAVRVLGRSESSLFPASAILEEDSSSEEDFYDAEDRSDAFDLPCEFSSTPSEAVDLLAAIDELVPAWMHVSTAKGQLVRVYAVNWGSSTFLFQASVCEEYLNKSPMAKSIEEKMEDHFSPRLSTHERSRRSVALYLNESGESGIQAIQQASPAFHEDFLKPKTKSADRHPAGTLQSGFAARAFSDRHWEEEWLMLSEQGVLFCCHPEKRRTRLRLNISHIISVSALPSYRTPKMQQYGFLCLKTLGRTIYFMFESTEKRDGWLNLLAELLKTSTADDQSNDSEAAKRILDIEQPSDEFLHKSTSWNCKNRRILNCGIYNLKCSKTIENPLDMVTESLRLSIDAYHDEEGERRHLFFQSTGALKRAIVQTLNEESRLAFFLNLYHTMVMHAFLVLGPPGSGLKWISFFNNLAYEIGDDIFSISELEHCIIRAKMAHPAQFMSRFVVPKSNYRMALQNADYRINFALNPGSTSNPVEVLVYSPENIDRQLDVAAAMYLEKASVTLKGSKEVVLQLPRVCQWFLEDFGSQDELPEKVLPFLRSNDRLAYQKASDAGLHVVIRYSDYSFKCRPLILCK